MAHGGYGGVQTNYTKKQNVLSEVEHDKNLLYMTPFETRKWVKQKTTMNQMNQFIWPAAENFMPQKLVCLEQLAGGDGWFVSMLQFEMLVEE